ncbi:MAG: methyltransferase domain-containing protein [Spirochaetales bacterium]|nr:methyltransferase domain-containing protein [Spirochaetales bacterium]
MNKVIHPPKSKAAFFLFIIGLMLRIINKIRHSIMGYTSPRPFSSARESERSVKYTLAVVENWRKALKKYTGIKNAFHNKHVLELGPGPDLGTGLVILALGAKSYTAIDRHNLISGAAKSFYKALFDTLRNYPAFKRARTALAQFQEQGSCEYFSYIYDRKFSLNKLCSQKYDVVVSQAVLEHLDNVGNTFEFLSRKLQTAAVMVHEVDLGTHTRWLRTVDPLNLLRYSDTLYRLLKFSGSPNRLRLADYRRILAESGFAKIQTEPLVSVADDYFGRAKPGFNKRFTWYADTELAVTSFYLLATACTDSHFNK